MLKQALAAVILLASGLSQGAPRLDAADVEAWADATFQRAFAERRFSGLAITVVQDDAVLLTRGYGYADFAKQLPVEPGRTRLRIGSITKTFTAMAIAQLMQRGLIRSIDDPVNAYLRRDRLPKVGGKEITLRHLLTHTAGFDSRAFGLGTEKTYSLPLSAAEVQAQRQPVVRELGDRSVYSNYGTALLAVIVEDITGQSIQRYFDENLFMPLKMDHSVINMTPRPSQDLAVPSRFMPDGSAQEQRFFGVHPFFAPVGAIESTAEDMGRYMIANLQQGRGASAAVLAPEPFRELHRRTAGNHPATSGFGMVFISFEWNGVTFFGHGGDWPGFHSIMLMSPESNAGFFISCMCEYPQPGLLESVLGSQRMRANSGQQVLAPMTNVGVAIAFLERFWGKRTWPRLAASGDLEKYVGSYWHEFRNYSSAEKLFDVLGGESSTLVVERDGDRALSLNGRGGYGEIAPGVFWNAQAEPGIDGNFWNSGIWAFTLDSAGAPRHVSPTFAIDSYRRVSNFDNPQFAMQVLMLCGVFSLTGALAAFWPAGRGLGRAGKWLPPAIAGALLAIVPVMLAGYPEGDGLGTALLLGEGTRLLSVVLLANLVAILGLAMAVATLLAWQRGYWGYGWRAVARRTHFTLLSVAAAGLIWVFAFANLLGLKLP